MLRSLITVTQFMFLYKFASIVEDLCLVLFRYWLNKILFQVYWYHSFGLGIAGGFPPNVPLYQYTHLRP